MRVRKDLLYEYLPERKVTGYLQSVSVERGAWNVERGAWNVERDTFASELEMICMHVVDCGSINPGNICYSIFMSLCSYCISNY